MISRWSIFCILLLIIALSSLLYDQRRVTTGLRPGCMNINNLGGFMEAGEEAFD